ncbi:nucleotidyltransferase domain-containing protein [Bradyrhizobium sp. BWA-3-5]|uniref:nucleotidyltransferase domain-containing protein n=1 Tax=Bradyrhizobium sp. BWA-3-5 TaxID=3080013 RepID=UPI00293F4D2A|nr:nucleotidyltransferase domain-containing protein [Bradyrhizobium sp. BWA-3-5]WOH67044.1 nucleotidyltransferase domain-containing protein [Bradyrhizobium sp. BWA-3-5]
MSLRSIPPEMDGEKVALIDALLDRIADEYGVFLPLAIESGSRAWGFSSPDSDYDCRFIFVRRVAAHITPWPARDVIEFPPEDDLDANGWDLGKALRLLLKGNAVIVEWLRSPVIYRGQGWFRDGFLEFARHAATREAMGRHYLHLGERQRRVYFGDGTDVAQKKIFYALRPAATLRWLRMRPREAIAPMHFPTLMEECDPPAELSKEVTDLMSRKLVTRELGAAPLAPAVSSFIDSEFQLARALFEGGRARAPEEVVAQAERFYRAVVERLEREDKGSPIMVRPA